MTCILIVDDEQDLVWGIQNVLRDEGYEVLTAYNGVEALCVAERRRPDLIILDVVMPRLDGLQVCRRLRRDPTLAAVPILFLTVRSDVQDRIKGLDEGADDYLVKPFNLGELKARVRALLRRRQGAPIGDAATRGRQFVLSAGPLTLDMRTCQLNVGGSNVQLTPTEFELLRYLMIHAGETFTSQQLLQQVWGYSPNSTDPSLVRVHIKNLREKIEPDPSNPTYILTIPRHGYMLERRHATL